ncbi:CYFIP-related Rac1 interactor A-like [Entelurus aequoreus]|uniref:CYFIP-related Rac1 interactor A-like n=1 Tax=Entelurus aequoreus TaxID=161455 RepID=UPI002B1D34AE|nr:CYFIP-related Rac1 interactor A-like [Entelurus aequoreus]
MPVNASMPINTSLPVNTYVPVNASIPINTYMPVNTSLPVNTYVPVNASIPINTNMPVNASMPFNTYLPVNTSLPVNTYMPVNIYTPINTSLPNKTLPLENTTDCLSTMASVCKVMLETPEYSSRFSSDDTVLFCMRVMVGVIILYDHVHPIGAFNKSSKIDMKGCIKVLKEQPADNVEGLLNALRFTTKHLNQESTPRTIRSMLQ